MTLFFLRHYLFAKNSSTLVRRIAEISFGAVTLASSAFLIVLFIMNAMNDNTKKRLVSIEPHAVLTPTSGKNLLGLEAQLAKVAPELGLQWQKFEKQDLVIQTPDGIFRGAQGYGLESAGLKRLFANIKNLNKPSVQVITKYSRDEQEHEDLDADEVLLGADLARALGVIRGDHLNVLAPEELLAPGQSLPHLERLLVAGIIRTNIPEYDAQIVLYNKNKSLISLRESLSHTEGFELISKEPLTTHWDQFIKRIQDGKLQTWEEMNSALLYALKVEKIAIGFILSLAAIVASLSLFTVVSLLIKNRQHDIAILRTLGLSYSRCQNLFAGIGVLLAGSALVAGVLIGTGVSLFLEYHPLNIMPDIFYDTAIQAHVDWHLIVGVLLTGFAFISAGTWFSARSVQEVQPSELLKH